MNLKLINKKLCKELDAKLEEDKIEAEDELEKYILLTIKKNMPSIKNVAEKVFETKSLVENQTKIPNFLEEDINLYVEIKAQYVRKDIELGRVAYDIAIYCPYVAYQVSIIFPNKHRLKEYKVLKIINEVNDINNHSKHEIVEEIKASLEGMDEKC